MLDPIRYPELTYVFTDVAAMQWCLKDKPPGSLPYDEGEIIGDGLEVVACKKLTLKKCFWNPSLNVVHDGFLSGPCVYLVNIKVDRAPCKVILGKMTHRHQLIDITVNCDRCKNGARVKVSLIYFQYENLNFLVDFLLANQLHVHTLIHVNDGGGSLGGSHIPMNFIYQVYDRLKIQRMISEYLCGWRTRPQPDIDCQVLLNQYQKSNEHIFREFRAKEDFFARNRIASRSFSQHRPYRYDNVNHPPDNDLLHFRIDTRSQEFQDLWYLTKLDGSDKPIYEIDKRTEEQKEQDRRKLEKQLQLQEQVRIEFENQQKLKKEQELRDEPERQRLQKIWFSAYKKNRIKNINNIKKWQKLIPAPVRLNKEEHIQKQNFDISIKKRKVQRQVSNKMFGALKRKDMIAIAALMNKGTDIGYRNNEGLTIISYARQLGLAHLLKKTNRPVRRKA
jgi:hypothetical protein